MDTLEAVKNLLKSALQLGDRADSLTADSPLHGAIAEFDSMAVVTVLTMMEDQYDIRVDDDDVSAETFATVGSLARFLAQKLEE